MMALVVAIAVLALGVLNGAGAQEICEEFGSVQVANKFFVMNNRWGTTAEHCIRVKGTGFEITKQNGNGIPNSSPVSYPAIVYGCHYTNCSPGTKLPMKLSDINSATSKISYTFVSGATYNAAYDIWLDPVSDNPGNNAMEIMIWMNKIAPVQPIGSSVGDASIVGHNWDVWTGSNGKNNVISYVSYSAIPSITFSLRDFLIDAKNRGFYTDQWYVTSIQAGFEPWVGGVGLAVNDFDAQIN